MSFEYRIEDSIVIFTFNNGKLNSIPQKTLKGLEEVVDRLNNEEGLKGLILTGAGKYFSGGFDLGTFTSFNSDQEIADWFLYEEEVMYKVFTCSKPVVAAVNGHATAAGMILSMASDYRMVVNNPKVKVGMTEIKIGLALSPAQGEIMRFGLDTDKKYRDVIFSGELMNPVQAVEKGIFDELVENPDDLLDKAKAKVCSFIDTPGRPFINLKFMEKRHAAAIMKKDLDEADMAPLIKVFTDENIINTLKMVKAALGE
jgi:enoyl-CoA hydratase/carnithine racemase